MLKRARALFLSSLGVITALVFVGSANADTAPSQQYASRSHEVSQAAYDIHDYDVDLYGNRHSRFWFYVLRYVCTPQIARRSSGEFSRKSIG